MSYLDDNGSIAPEGIVPETYDSRLQEMHRAILFNSICACIQAMMLYNILTGWSLSPAWYWSICILFGSVSFVKWVNNRNYKLFARQRLLDVLGAAVGVGLLVVGIVKLTPMFSH